MKRIPSPVCDVTITAQVTKMCPVLSEVDHGTVEIAFRTVDSAFELHDLAEYLATFTERHVSHEFFTAEVAQRLEADVTSTWHTAGLEVRVAVLRQPVH